MKYFIFTLGCQMNIADSERIDSFLRSKGNKATDEKHADLIVINACSVRQKAVDRIWGKIKIWVPQKKKIIITGCVLPTDKKKLAEKGIKFQDFQNSDFSKIIPYNLSPITYVSIMTGCNNFCSYCAVPYTRGREKSRPLEDIIEDVNKALQAGSKNILLLGQNVNSYQFGFSNLLKKIDSLDGDFEFNFMTSNPHDMTEEIIDTFSKLKKWPRELHLAMQSGDDEILKKMNRKCSSDQYLKLIENLKLKIKNLVLTTDIIVGFPSESEKQFENTLKICKKIGFKKAYISQYSPRAGTVSAKMKDDILPSEKKRRWNILNDLINI